MLSIPLAYLSGPAALATEQIGPLSLREFARNAEFEADLLGIEYQYAAGYDPQVFVEALEKFQSQKSQAKSPKASLHGKIARAFASYPPTEERIRKVQTEISTFLHDRNDYVFDTSEFQEVKAKLAWSDRPILRRHSAGEYPTNGPVLRRSPSPESEQQ